MVLGSQQKAAAANGGGSCDQVYIINNYMLHNLTGDAIQLYRPILRYT